MILSLMLGAWGLLLAPDALAGTPFENYQTSLSFQEQQCIAQQAYAMGLDYDDLLLLRFFRDYGIPYHAIPHLPSSFLQSLGVTPAQRDDAWSIGLDYEDLLC